MITGELGHTAIIAQLIVLTTWIYVVYRALDWWDKREWRAMVRELEDKNLQKLEEGA